MAKAKVPGKPRNRPMSVAISEDDYEEICATAKENGLSVSGEIYRRLSLTLGYRTLEGALLHQSLANYKPLASFGVSNG